MSGQSSGFATGRHQVVDNDASVPLRAAVFVDRDGVLNRARVVDGRPYPPESVDGFELLEGVADAVGALRAAGYLVVVATNQPDIATGKTTIGVVTAMHDLLRRQLAVDDIRMCVHTDADRCDCRKPKPGMLIQAAADLHIDLGRSFMVGDRWRDVDAGAAAACRTFFVDYGYRERPPDHPPDYVVDGLAAAARIILTAAESG